MKIIHFDYNTGFSIMELDENDEKAAQYLTQDMVEDSAKQMTFSQVLKLMVDSMNRAAESIRNMPLISPNIKFEPIEWDEPAKAKRSPYKTSYVPEWREMRPGLPWIAWMPKLESLEDAQRIVIAMLDQQNVRPRCPEYWQENDDAVFPWVYGCSEGDEHVRGRIRVIHSIEEFPEDDEPEIAYTPEDLRIVYSPESLPWGITKWQKLVAYVNLDDAKHALEIELAHQALASQQKGKEYQWFETESNIYPWVYGISPQLHRGRIQKKILRFDDRDAVEIDEW